MSKILFVCSDNEESSMYWAIEKSKQTLTNSLQKRDKNLPSPRQTHIISHSPQPLMANVMCPSASMSVTECHLRGKVKRLLLFRIKVYRSCRGSRAVSHQNVTFHARCSHLKSPQTVSLFPLVKHLVAVISAPLGLCMGFLLWCEIPARRGSNHTTLM